MSERAEMAERHGAVLRELTELGLALARDLQAAAMAADAPEVKGRLAADFHRVARSARQSMALEARLLRDRARFEEEDTALQAKARERAVKAATSKVRAAVGRLAWTEAEDPDDEAGDVAALIEQFERQLDFAMVEDDFPDQPIELLVARLCREIGLLAPDCPEPTGQDAPDLPPDPDSS